MTIQTGVVGRIFTDHTAINGTRYYYEVIVVDDFGQSDPSPIVDTVPSPAQIVAAATSVSEFLTPTTQYRPIGWPPVLDSRDEEQLAAEAIARTSGGLTVERIDSNIEIQRRMRDLVLGGSLSRPVCPELTNANPSSPHTVLLEALAWLIGQLMYRANLFPVRDQIEIARLFGTAPRAALPARATLLFTIAAPTGQSVTIPQGTVVSTEDAAISFTTDAELVIAAGESSASVQATRSVAGETELSSDTLTRMVDAVAYVSGVTNIEAVDSGSDAETIESALQRARSYQRRGERLVSAQDVEDAVLNDVLRGNGIVKVFPLVAEGDFSVQRVGHTSVVVMTRTGLPVSDAVKQQIIEMLQRENIGNPFFYVLDPVYVDFNVAATLRFTGLVTQEAAKFDAERKLRDFYAPSVGNFGRSILRAEIIAVIEAAEGVLRIEAPPAGAILASPVADQTIAPYAFPRLVNVIFHVA